MTGFNELIPPDLVNVFDERELELLIGGIADIDVEDWKKHTDYRGYTEQDQVIRNFWTVSVLPCREQSSTLTHSNSASEAGMLSKSHGCCSSPLAPPVFQSTASKTCKEVMDHEDSPSRNQALTKHCLNPTHGKLLPIFASKDRTIH